MNKLVTKFRSARVKRDEGATAVEYGLIVAAIAAVIIITVIALGSRIEGAFFDTCDKVKSSNTTACK